MKNHSALEMWKAPIIPNNFVLIFSLYNKLYITRQNLQYKHKYVVQSV